MQGWTFAALADTTTMSELPVRIDAPDDSCLERAEAHEGFRRVTEIGFVSGEGSEQRERS